MRLPALLKNAVTAAALAAGMASPAMAQVQASVKEAMTPAPASVIYIGNSFFYYNNSMHGQVGNMVSEGMKGHKYRGSSVTISGSGLDWHDVDAYFRPDGIGKYSFVENNRVVFNPPAGKLFDVAVMMDCSQCPIHPTLKAIFTAYAKKHSETVRKHGATPVFFMSWAYQDAPEMTQSLADAYTVAGNANQALVIPAGLAFARSIALRPEINLYVADKRHPSPAGTYLAAATTYAALFNQSPVGLQYNAGLKPEVATHLQQVAWSTVKAYLGR